jgi:chromosomal replication initiator protein
MASWISLNGPLSLSQAEELLRDLLRQEAENCITIDRIQRLTAESFDIRLADMVSRKRTAAIAFARQAAMHLARELTGLSYHEIGEAFGGRDHGTVMHACRTVEKRLRDDESLRLRITALETGLRRSI